MTKWVRRFVSSGRVVVIAPLLLLFTLLAWSFSSPVGSSPDEDFHLVSIWCATGDDASCVQEDGKTFAEIPGALAEIACFAFDSTVSAECQRELDFAGEPDTTTTRGNFYGAYPSGFYAVLSVFVGQNIEASVLAMRIALSVIFTAFASLLFFLLPAHRRQTLVWSWVVTTVPVGLFIITSINPSAWAVAGVGFGWLALAGFFESHGWRKFGLGALFVLAVLMASGARGDAAMYMVLAIAATSLASTRPSTTRSWDSSRDLTSRRQPSRCGSSPSCCSSR
jgi:hypothetical protein